eukprot:2658345-Rhodomonas_salina.2
MRLVRNVRRNCEAVNSVKEPVSMFVAATTHVMAHHECLLLLRHSSRARCKGVPSSETSLYQPHREDLSRRRSHRGRRRGTLAGKTLKRGEFVGSLPVVLTLPVVPFLRHCRIGS